MFGPLETPYVPLFFFPSSSSFSRAYRPSFAYFYSYARTQDTFDRVLVSLRLLRSYGCTLPATVFHFPSEHPSDSQLDDFAALDASVLPLPSLNKNPKPGQTKNFQIKGAALVEAPYDEILMLDSDNLPARDVTHLFDSPEFKEMGMVMWPDYFKDQPEVRFILPFLPPVVPVVPVVPSLPPVVPPSSPFFTD